MSQRQPTSPFVGSDKLWHVQHEFQQHFVPVTCCAKFNELNPVQHVAGNKQLKKVRVMRAKNYQHTRGDVSLRHVPGTCPYYIFLRVYPL